jgi:signal transduction histidine kinase
MSTQGAAEPTPGAPTPEEPPPAASIPGTSIAGAPTPGVVTAVRTWLWGWLAMAQLVCSLVLSAPYLVVVGVLLAGVLTVPAFLAGVPMVAIALALAFCLGYVERWRLQAFTGVAVPPATGPRAETPTWRRLLDGRPWRASLHLLLISVWGLTAGSAMLFLTSVAVALVGLPFYRSALPDDQVSLPFGGTLSADAAPALAVAGLVALAVLPLLARGLVGLDIALVRWLLGPSGREQVAQLSQRVQTLTQTREATVDSVEVERRRIERDLHDGPQQRLVSIAMDLGMARERLDRDPDGARELLDKAHVAAKEAITEMRHVARGIHPPVLTDRGLDAALSALAARSPVPVQVSFDVPQRPTPTIEAIAYFCVSEALTNVAKHARARQATVEVTGRDGTLAIRISDDGVGGAEPGGGTGLDGLRGRVAAVDGRLEVDSPAGGPTVLTVTLPTRTR